MHSHTVSRPGDSLHANGADGGWGATTATPRPRPVMQLLLPRGRCRLSTTTAASPAPQAAEGVLR
jgi:hypothetical protein